jgi:hypothetical protein
MKTFYFNTGVRRHTHNPPVKLEPGYVDRNGTMQIPFDCEDVPEGAVFKFACDNPDAAPGLIVREIHNSALVSRYAFFTPPL